MSKLDKSTINYPDEMPNMAKENIIFQKWVDKISTKRKKNPRLLIITDWEFFVLKKKTFSKKLILSYNFKWYDITTIESSDQYPNEFTLFFRNDKNANKRTQVIQKENTKVRIYFTFEYLKTRKLLEKFYTYLLSFHMKEDIPIFKYPPLFTFPTVETSIPEYIRMKQRLNNHRISSSTLNAIKNFIASQPTRFCFTEIRGVISILPLFLHCIHLIPSLKELIIPFDANFNCLKILDDFLIENKSITSLTFKQKLPENFDSFTETFLSSSSTKIINSFKFINSKFSIQNVKDLSNIVKKRNIHSLHLKNVFLPISMPPFKYYFEHNTSFQQIRELTIDHAHLVDIRSFMPFLKNVTSLSLIQCGFQIADFFAGLTHDYQMSYLNLSQNKNEKTIFDPITFPRFLSVLILQNIEWDKLSIVQFVDSLMNHEPESNDLSMPDNELKLDLSHLNMQESFWDNFFNKLEHIHHGNLVGLRWDNNSIDKRFVKFIDSFKNLKSLSLNGCIIKNDDDLLALLQLITKSRSLEYLSFAGTDLKNMGRQVLSVLDTLYINRSIKSINVSNHNCGDSILVKLCDVLMENRVVEEITFKKNGITDISLYALLFFAMEKRGKPLFFEFPKSFARSMRQFGKLKKKDFISMESMYNLMVTGNSKVKKIPEYTLKRKDEDENENEEEDQSKKDDEFILKNYDDETTAVDYDPNAMTRRIKLENRYKKVRMKRIYDQMNQDASENEEKVKKKKKRKNTKSKKKSKAKSKNQNEENEEANKEGVHEKEGAEEENSSGKEMEEEENQNEEEGEKIGDDASYSELQPFVIAAHKDDSKTDEENPDETNLDVNTHEIKDTDDESGNNFEADEKKHSKKKHKRKHKKSKSGSKKEKNDDDDVELIEIDDLNTGPVDVKSESSKHEEIELNSESGENKNEGIAFSSESGEHEHDGIAVDSDSEEVLL